MYAELHLVPQLSMSGYKHLLSLYAFIFILYCLSHINSKCVQLSSDTVTSLRKMHMWSHIAVLLSTDIANISVQNLIFKIICLGYESTVPLKMFCIYVQQHL